MSYCRFSSDDYLCDVYVYTHCDGGYRTHVARTRVEYTEPLPPKVPFTEERWQEYMDRWTAVNELFKKSGSKSIGLPYDGDTFHDDTATECAERLTLLQSLGYNVPSYAIEALREEADDKPSP